MALQLWLPLNGNTVNQGVSDLECTGKEPTSWTYGGKVTSRAAYFDGNTSQDEITLHYYDGELSYTDNFTWCLWVKSIYDTSNTSEDQYIFSVGSPEALIYGDGYGLKRIESGYSILFGSLLLPGIIETSDDTWQHIAFVKQGGDLRTYVNGILLSDRVVLFTGTLPTYYCEEMGLGCRRYNGGDCYSICTINDFRIYDNALSAREIHEIAKGLALHYPLNDVYCTDSNTNEELASSTVYDTSGFGNNGTVGSTITRQTTDGAETITLTGTNYTDSFHVSRVTNDNAETITVEQTDNQQPLAVTSAPRNNIGYSLAAKQYIRGTTPWGAYTIPEFTVSLWANQISGDTYSTLMSCDGHSDKSIWIGVNIEGHGAWTLWQPDSSSSIYATSDTTLPTNTWHLFTYVFDNGTVSLYLDGALQSTATSTSSTTMGIRKYFYLGAPDPSLNLISTSENNTFVGYLSDFRWYATALSAADIKELYDTPVALANTGVLMTQGEYSENDNLGIFKTGILQGSDFVESDDGASITSTNFNANNFVEY